MFHIVLQLTFVKSTRVGIKSGNSRKGLRATDQEITFDRGGRLIHRFTKQAASKTNSYRLQHGLTVVGLVYSTIYYTHTKFINLIYCLFYCFSVIGIHLYVFNSTCFNNIKSKLKKRMYPKTIFLKCINLLALYFSSCTMEKDIKIFHNEDTSNSNSRPQPIVDDCILLLIFEESVISLLVQ